MRVDRSDERDSGWELHSPRFRVYLFEPPPTGSGLGWSTTTWDITEADALEVVRWAQSHVPTDGRYAVALVGDRSPLGEEERGVTWLVGMDANDSALNAREADILDRMRTRQGKIIVTDE